MSGSKSYRALALHYRQVMANPHAYRLDLARRQADWESSTQRSAVEMPMPEFTPYLETYVEMLKRLLVEIPLENNQVSLQAMSGLIRWGERQLSAGAPNKKDLHEFMQDVTSAFEIAFQIIHKVDQTYDGESPTALMLAVDLLKPVNQRKYGLRKTLADQARDQKYGPENKNDIILPIPFFSTDYHPFAEPWVYGLYTVSIAFMEYPNAMTAHDYGHYYAVYNKGWSLEATALVEKKYAQAKSEFLRDFDKMDQKFVVNALDFILFTFQHEMGYPFGSKNILEVEYDFPEKPSPQIQEKIFGEGGMNGPLFRKTLDWFNQYWQSNGV